MTHGLEERDVNRTHRPRLTLALGAALIAGASLSGIAAAQDTELPTVPETPVPLEFLYSPFTDYAPFFVAKEKGYFEENGLDVTLTIKSGSAETTQLLAAGQSQAGGDTWGSAFFNTIPRARPWRSPRSWPRSPRTPP